MKSPGVPGLIFLISGYPRNTGAIKEIDKVIVDIYRRMGKE